MNSFKTFIVGFFSDPLFVAFWFYFGKILFIQMTLIDAIFMASLVIIQCVREYLKHQEKLKNISLQSDLANKVRMLENEFAKLDYKVGEVAQSQAASSILKRRV